jgi:hypothetical protein
MGVNSGTLLIRFYGFPFSSVRTCDLSMVSLGLFDVLATHFSICLMLTSCVVIGDLMLTSSLVTAPGSIPSVQGCLRNSFTASAAASYSDSAATSMECRIPAESMKETVQVRTFPTSPS